MHVPFAKPAVSWMLVALLPPLLVGLGGLGGSVVKSKVWGSASVEPLMSEPQTIVVAPREFSYRAAGDYYKDGYAVDGPMHAVSMTHPLTIMKYQVTAADYELCVAAGACAAAEPEYPTGDRKHIPVTGISHGDAQAYAAWLSQRTGEVWTLPTDEQLAFAAGSRFPDDALGADPSNANPAVRWLATYRRESELKAARDPAPKPAGFFGENEYGIADFGGNIWEWTTTCSRRINVGSQPQAKIDTGDCGIYHAIGKHRAPMVFFVRNPKGGGCAVGTPPDNLGFRLVKDTRWYAPLVANLRGRGLLR